jgi:hypothetical protein
VIWRSGDLVIGGSVTTFAALREKHSSARRLEALLAEANELVAIFSASRSTVRS